MQISSVLKCACFEHELKAVGAAKTLKSSSKPVGANDGPLHASHYVDEFMLQRHAACLLGCLLPVLPPPSALHLRSCMCRCRSASQHAV